MISRAKCPAAKRCRRLRYRAEPLGAAATWLHVFQMSDDRDDQELPRDWQAFLARVDAHLVPLPPVIPSRRISKTAVCEGLRHRRLGF